MSTSNLIAAGTVFVASCVGVTVFWHEIGDVVHRSRDVIVAEVVLDNRCGLRDHVFILRDTNTGKYASFAGGRAKLRTIERNRVQVEYSPMFRDVEYHGYAYPAKRSMTLVADCRSKSLVNMDWL